MDIERFEELRRNSDIDPDYLADMTMKEAAVLLVIEEYLRNVVESPDYVPPSPAKRLLGSWQGPAAPPPDHIANEVNIPVREVLEIVGGMGFELWGRVGPTRFTVVDTSVGPTLWFKGMSLNYWDMETVGQQQRGYQHGRKGK